MNPALQPTPDPAAQQAFPVEAPNNETRASSGSEVGGTSTALVSSIRLRLVQRVLKLTSALVDERFKDIVASIGRRAPDIPGSTASILAALLGLAMGKMAIAVSDDGGNRFSDARRRLDELSEQLTVSADRDRRHFRRYLDVLSEEPSDHEAADDSGLHEAQAQATEEPLAAAHLIVKGLELFRDVAGSIDRKVASDLHSGASVLSAAFCGAMMAAEINLRHQVAMRRRTFGERADLYRRRGAALEQLEKVAADLDFRY